jgi:eukaryotic-like serine/threonine-protein kinase
MNDPRGASLVGCRLGVYQALAPIGTGGMGDVYRARDTRLNRDVALKVLPREFTSDPDRLARFEREARALAALNHPNIVTIFDVGTADELHFLVTELLDGETLRDRIRKGSFPVEQMLDVALQITEALSTAHRAGIIHRDIKPQNVFITRSGSVKLLDFGLAQLVTSSPGGRVDGETGEANGLTRQGVVLGTPAYMAPEQARGQAVDARSDVFACGCVLFEMLTGRSPFERASAIETLAAVLSDPAPALPPTPAVPRVIERTIARCLSKEPSDRFQSAQDLRFVLESARDKAFADGGSSGVAATRSVPVLGWTTAVAFAVGLGLGVGVSVLSRGDGGPPFPSVQAVTVVPASARPLTAAISPDGQWVTYVGLADGRPDLYVQFLNGGVPVNLTRGSDLPVQSRTVVGGLDVLADGSGIAVAGRPSLDGLFRVPGVWVIPAPSGGPARRVTDRYAAVRWAPDGRSIAGIIADPLVGDAVAVAAVDGQNEQILVPASGGVHLHQVAWGHDGRHVYYARTLEPRHWSSDIYRVAVGGGAPEPVVVGEGVAMFPAPTPDGRALVYAGDHRGEGMNIWWRPFDGSLERRLTAGAAEYTEPFVGRRGGQLVTLARRRKGELLRVSLDEPASSAMAFGEAGSGDSDPSVSAGSEHVFISSLRSGRRKIWSLDSAGRQAVPLTAGEGDDVRPAVSVDGRWVAFISNRGGRRGIWVVPADGGTPRLIVHAEVIDYVSWAPDGRRLIYAAPAGDDGTALWTVGVDGDAPLRIPDASGRTPAWSPVGDVIATVRATEELPWLHFVKSSGGVAREPLPIREVGVPTAIAWSPDGSHLALINLPGRAAAEAWILRLSDGTLRKVAEHAAPAELDGITWTKDGRGLVMGRIEYETEVLLLRGLPGGS